MALLFITKNYSQEPELFRTWHLTKVTVNNINYIPSDYGYFPELYIAEEGDYYFIALADPANISCSSSIENFQTNPNSFIVNQDWLCLPDHTCYDDPINGPCWIIYGRHAEIYYGIATPFTYIIEQNGDETFTLEIANTDGNQAYYSSEFLSNEDFKYNKFTIYPNPVSDILTLSSNEAAKKTMVYDIHGRLVEPIRSNNTNSIEMDVRHLQNGMYFIKIETENGNTVTKKFVKR